MILFKHLKYRIGALFMGGISYLVVVMVMLPFGLFAQSKTITGTVIATQGGEPLPGVNVLVKGTNTGVATDFYGNYSIEASASDVLVFSYIGFKSQEITVGSGNTVDASLELDNTSLEEVVVIGYGTQKKADLTGSVSVIDASEAQKVSNSDISQLLQG